MMIGRINNLLDRLEIPFVLFWEFMLIIRMVSVYTLLPSTLDSGIFTVIAFVGACLLLRNGILWLMRKKKLDLLLVIFTIAMGVSSIASFTGLVANIKIIFWQMLFFFVVYELGNREDKRIFVYVEKLLIFLWFVLVSISLGMFLARFSYTMPLDKLYYGIRLGFFENRLYGVFVDPNYAATISVVALLFSIHLNTKTTSNLFKGFLGLNIAFQFLYVVLSGSRTAQIELFAAAIVLSFFISYSTMKNINGIKKIVKPALTAICVVLATGVLYIGTQKVSVTIINQIDQTTSVQRPEDDEGITLNREDVDTNSDSSNGRLKLWASAFEIFKTRKLVGTSPRNYVEYAQEHLPNTWISLKEQTPHNFFFYLLATTGLLGTIPFTLFILVKIFQSLATLFNMKTSKYFSFVYAVTIALVILISACLITDIVLVNKLGAMLFFLYLGRVNYRNTEIKKEELG